jgi:hypothetical protein
MAALNIVLYFESEFFFLCKDAVIKALKLGKESTGVKKKMLAVK